MIGAILGDIIGSPYEFNQNNIKTKDFPLFSDKSEFTDDTVMTLAVAEALMSGGTADDFKKSMKKLGNRYPDAGYGANFIKWLRRPNAKPYGSYGNGSAMRVSPVAWMFDNMDDVLKYAEISAAVTHNHPEGIKGAQATAAAIFMGRKGAAKADIKAYIEDNFGYDLSRTCDEIRPTYKHVESCQETVPEAIIAFMEGQDFEDVVRTAVSLGGDSDTLTAIAGSIAEGFYGVPDDLKEKGLSMLTDDLREIYDKFIGTIK